MTAPNPNGPGALMRAASAAFKRRVADFLQESGPATNEEMCNALGCEIRYLRHKLAAMVSEGIVHSELIPAPGRCPFVAVYSFGAGEDGIKREMSQRTVHKWKPQPFQIDPITAALFAAKQHGELTK